jgi:hypothetical protein
MEMDFVGGNLFEKNLSEGKFCSGRVGKIVIGNSWNGN